MFLENFITRSNVKKILFLNFFMAKMISKRELCTNGIVLFYFQLIFAEIIYIKIIKKTANILRWKPKNEKIKCVA